MSSPKIFVVLFFSLVAAFHPYGNALYAQTAQATPTPGARTGSASEELAKQLMNADSDEQRSEILAANSAALAPSLEDALYSLGATLRAQGQYDKARNCYRSMQEVAVKTNDRMGEAKALRNLGVLARVQERFSEALDYSQKAMAIAERINNQDMVAICLNSIGSVYTEQGNYREAMKTFKASLATAQSVDDKELTANLL